MATPSGYCGEPSLGVSSASFFRDLESGENNFRITKPPMEPSKNDEKDTQVPKHAPGAPSDESNKSTLSSVSEPIANVLTFKEPSVTPPRAISPRSRLAFLLWLSPRYMIRAIHQRLKNNESKITDGRLDQLKAKSIEQHPPGYPRLAAFVDTDPNFKIYRRFGTLRNRIGQQKQYELARLERKLDELDQKDHDDDGKRFCLSSIEFDQELGTERQALLREIEKKLHEYDAFMESEHKSLSLARPTRRNHLSLIHYIWNQKSLYQPEVELFNRTDDIIIISPEQDSRFHAWLEGFLQQYTFKWLQRRFVSPLQLEKTEDSAIRLYSKDRIEKLVRFIILFMTVALVMIPVCVLFITDISDLSKFFIVLVFVLIFPVTLSVFSKAKNHELIAATAAYTAVLVVFLQNATTGIISPSSEDTFRR